MDKNEILQIFEMDFLNIDEKIKILTNKGVNIDKSLINIILDSERDLEFQISTIKEIKDNIFFKNEIPLKIDSSKKNNIYSKKEIIPKEISKTKKNRTRVEIDKDLNESKATRPLTDEEFNKIISLFQHGVKYTDKKGSKRRIEPNRQLALILSVQATIGFRINDILRMKLRDIRGSKISFIEQKTKKLQYRQVNIDFVEALQNYADELELGLNDYLFNTTARNIQMILKKATDFLGYNYIGTHSFRKFYAVNAYKASNNNLELVRNLLNHSSVSITQRYINVDQDEIDEYSSSVNFLRKGLI